MGELDKIKQNISTLLERIGLGGRVSLDEIEQELSRVDTAFQSLLLLGILSRIIHYGDNKAVELFVPAITEWKNYLPHPELGGLSPAQMLEKNPPGPAERFFITAMLKEYEARLEAKAESEPDIDIDIESDFAAFQDEFLKRVPSEQIFSGVTGRLMSVKEIIMEERRQNNRPEKDIDKIGIKIFAENTAEGASAKIEAIEDTYITALKELEEMQRNPKKQNKKRIRAIRKQFERDEPYHRVGPAPHQFYSNYAAVVLIDDENVELARAMLDRSLSYKPDYTYALEMKRRLKAYYG